MRQPARSRLSYLSRKSLRLLQLRHPSGLSTEAPKNNKLGTDGLSWTAARTLGAGLRLGDAPSLTHSLQGIEQSARRRSRYLAPWHLRRCRYLTPAGDNPPLSLKSGRLAFSRSRIRAAWLEAASSRGARHPRRRMVAGQFPSRCLESTAAASTCPAGHLDDAPARVDLPVAKGGGFR